MKYNLRDIFLSLSSIISISYITSPVLAQSFPDPSKPIVSTQEACDKTTETMWIIESGKGECIRYYTSGLRNANSKAILYIHGDTMWGTDQSVVSSYKAATAAFPQERVDGAFKDTGIPVIMIARPGLYGSSGEHSKRRQPRELALMEEAMNQIRAKYKIDNIAITGQSGGGSVAAYLAAKSPDAKCLVFTSSALSLQKLRDVGQNDGYFYGDNTIYDPAKHISEMVPGDQRRFFIIGDPQDEYARIENQKDYYERAKSAGLDVIRMEAEGDGHHSLDRTGWTVAGWCMNGISAEEIRKRIAAHEVTF